MITTSDFSKGTRILLDGEPVVLVDVTTQSPSARGSATLVKFKARNLLTGKLISESVKSGTKFEEPDIRYAKVQYLYDENDDAIFMDQETFEQFPIPRERIGNAAKYLNEELKIRAMYLNDAPVNIELPSQIPCKVARVEPGSRGNTASGTVTTQAELEDGTQVRVPLNIKDGDLILVDPDDDSFQGRA